jgi:xylitol oxidase
VLRTLPRIEAALGRFRPRPHWGKVFTAPPAVFEAGYPMLGEFRAVATALDPGGKLRNPYLDRLIFGR